MDQSGHAGSLTQGSLAPLIVLEGIDGAGKGTQAALLKNRMNAEEYRTSLLSFPRYQHTFFGARIGEFLDGQFGTLDQLDPFLISLLYAGDRFESRRVLQESRSGVDALILDRYVPSNIAHQSAKRTGDERARLRSWIEQIEYGIFELPRPNLVVLLDLPVETAQELIARKSRRSYTDQTRDLQETDVAYLAQVRDVYLQLATDPAWVVVPVTSSGTLRTIEEIGEAIWDIVKQHVLRSAVFEP